MQNEGVFASRGFSDMSSCLNKSGGLFWNTVWSVQHTCSSNRRQMPFENVRSAAGEAINGAECGSVDAALRLVLRG